MRPSGHLHSTTIALVLILHFNLISNAFEGFLFLLGAMLLDGDFILTKLFFHIDNHRDFITHSAFFYIALLVLASLLNSSLKWLFVGSLFHLLFDIFDWGLPFKPTTYVTPHLLSIPDNKDEIFFFKAYFSHSIIVLLEIALLIGFVVSLLFLRTELVLVVLFIEIGVIMEFFFQLIQLKRLNIV